MLELAKGQYPYPTNRNPGIIEMLDMIAKDQIQTSLEQELYSDDFKDFIARWYYFIIKWT